MNEINRTVTFVTEGNIFKKTISMAIVLGKYFRQKNNKSY